MWWARKYAEAPVVRVHVRCACLRVDLCACAYVRCITHVHTLHVLCARTCACVCGVVEFSLLPPSGLFL